MINITHQQEVFVNQFFKKLGFKYQKLKNITKKTPTFQLECYMIDKNVFLLQKKVNS